MDQPMIDNEMKEQNVEEGEIVDRKQEEATIQMVTNL